MARRIGNAPQIRRPARAVRIETTHPEAAATTTAERAATYTSGGTATAITAGMTRTGTVHHSSVTDVDRAKMRPGVADVYDVYGIQAPLGRPRERLLTWVAFLQKTLTGPPSASASVDTIIDRDLRRQIFLLEGLLKLYDNNYPELSNALTEVKALEDAIGALTGAQHLAEETHDLSLPPATRAHIDDAVKDARAALTKLVAARWMPDEKARIPALADLVSTLVDLDWQRPKADRKYVLKRLAKRAKKIDAFPYKMEVLQGDEGLHEFRRDIRWIPIIVEALDGLIQLDPSKNPVDAYRRLLITDAAADGFVSDIAASKFMRLPDDKLEKKPKKISLSLYAANMRGVLDFGGLKDRGETIENLAHALVAAGDANAEDSRDKASALLGVPSGTFSDITGAAQRMYAELKKNGLLKALQESFE